MSTTPAISASSSNSTFVYQRDEIRNAFWPAPGYATFFITDDFAMLRNSVGGGMPSKYKTIELDGDLDLFGDNSVYIHRAVSHTPGSQILVVRLPKTGTVVLTSDAVYLQENLDKNILPSIGSVYDPSVCSTPMPGSGGSTTPRAATSSTRTIRTFTKPISTRPNITSDRTA